MDMVIDIVDVVYDILHVQRYRFAEGRLYYCTGVLCL